MILSALLVVLALHNNWNWPIYVGIGLNIIAGLSKLSEQAVARQQTKSRIDEYIETLSRSIRVQNN